MTVGGPRSHRGALQPSERGLDGKLLPLAGAAVLDLDRAGSDPARADDQLLGQADQVHRRELGARRLVAIVIEHLDPGAAQFAVEVVGGLAAAGVAGAQIDQPDPERRHALPAR